MCHLSDVTRLAYYHARVAATQPGRVCLPFQSTGLYVAFFPKIVVHDFIHHF